MFMVLIMLSTSTIGCSYAFGYRHTEMPTITVPAEPKKPNINSETIRIGDKVYIGYQVKEAMALYKFLLEKDAYEDKLIFRIEEMNKLIKELGTAKKR